MCTPTLVKLGPPIGENTLIGGGSVVIGDGRADIVVAGHPARSIRILPRKHPDHVNPALTGEHGRAVS